MNIRTISQLPKIEDVDDITNKSLFETSLYDDSNSTYSSKAITLSVLSKKISENSTSSLLSTYGLTDISGNAIKSSILLSNIIDLSCNDTSISGVKTYSISPIFKKIDESNLSSAANIGYVINSITNSGSYIRSDSSYTAAMTVDDSNIGGSLMQFNLESIGNSKWQSNVVETSKSGTFTCYGWLTDAGSVLPSQAWVALQGLINNNWIILQLKPWILGTNSSSLQYLGFTIPVKVGLKLMITTGFELDLSKTTYQNGSNTLVYNPNNPGTSITNTFI